MGRGRALLCWGHCGKAWGFAERLYKGVVIFFFGEARSIPQGERTSFPLEVSLEV